MLDSIRRHSFTAYAGPLIRKQGTSQSSERRACGKLSLMQMIRERGGWLVVSSLSSLWRTSGLSVVSQAVAAKKRMCLGVHRPLLRVHPNSCTPYFLFRDALLCIKARLKRLSSVFDIRLKVALSACRAFPQRRSCRAYART